MARTFNQMSAEAMADVTMISPAEAQRRLEADPNTLLIDVRDVGDMPATGTAPGAAMISYGALTYKADDEVPPEWRDPRLADRSRPIIVACMLGPLGAMGAKLLKDMGFSDVSAVEGGMVGWAQAGLPVEGRAGSE